MSLGGQGHCLSYREGSPGLAVPSLRRWPCWICLPPPLLAQSGLLAGAEDRLSTYKCQDPVSHRKSSSPSTCVSCHIGTFFFLPCPHGDAGRGAGWLVHPAEKTQQYPLSPTSCLGHHLGLLAMAFAVFSDTHGFVTLKGSEMDSWCLSAAHGCWMCSSSSGKEAALFLLTKASKRGGLRVISYQ